MIDKGSIVFSWQVSSFFGWGIYGLNLMLHWLFPALTAVLPGDGFLEDTAIERAQVTDLAELAMVVAGARWNEEPLSAAGIPNVVTVLQGVDCDLFQPGPASDTLRGRLKVFSSGKLEYRKGEDLVLLAFSIFAKRHPDAALVTAWSSPWPKLSEGFAANPAIGAPPLGPDGSIDLVGWAGRLGIPPGQIIDLGPRANCEMPMILRDMDAAIFPNRCEGGTNLVAMECLASGVPRAPSANTGHLDLIERTGCRILSRQLPVTVPPAGLRGAERWGESDVDEIVASLEWLYAHQTTARQQALQAAAAMAELSWKGQIGLLHETLKPVL